jgi:hypothetical protein
MIRNIIELLHFVDWDIKDEDINTAKGKYKLPDSWKEFKQILKQQK